MRTAYPSQMQEADLAHTSPGLPQRIGGFGASCSPETSLLLQMPKENRGMLRTLGDVGVGCCCGEDCFVQEWAPPRKVGSWLERECEVPADGFIFTASIDSLDYFGFRLPSYVPFCRHSHSKVTSTRGIPPRQCLCYVGDSE